MTHWKSCGGVNKILDIGRNSRQEAMAERSRRRFFARIVVSFSADDSLALLDDDRTFFGDSSGESLGSTSDDDQLDNVETGATLRNEPGDDEKNVMKLRFRYQWSHWLLAAQVNESTVLQNQLRRL